LREIKGLRLVCSTGPDNIPSKFIKLVAEPDVYYKARITKKSVLQSKNFPCYGRQLESVPFLKWMNLKRTMITGQFRFISLVKDI
jgi:hypothetical protein